MINLDKPFEPENIVLHIDEDGKKQWWIHTREGLELIGDELHMRAEHYKDLTTVVVTEYDSDGKSNSTP